MSLRYGTGESNGRSEDVTETNNDKKNTSNTERRPSLRVANYCDLESALLMVVLASFSGNSRQKLI
jgi:hypothetical protein